MVCGGGGGAAPAASREGAHAHLGGTLGGAIPSLHSNKTDSKRAWAHVYRRKRYHLKHVFFRVLRARCRWQCGQGEQPAAGARAEQLRMQASLVCHHCSVITVCGGLGFV